MEDKTYRFYLAILLTVLMAASLSVAQDIGYTPPPSLFTDKRAFRVGDVVTILLEEHSTGSNSAKSDADFTNRFELSNSATGKLDFLPGLGLNTSIKGDNLTKGMTSRSGSLRGKLAGKVTEIHSNGNLMLEGRRTIIVNGEEQITVLTGIVRPNDIRSDNTVYSYMIADAQITYRGIGEIDQVARPGIITRFLAWLF